MRSLILNKQLPQHFFRHNFDKDIRLNKDVKLYIIKGSSIDIAKLIIESLKYIF